MHLEVCSELKGSNEGEVHNSSRDKGIEPAILYSVFHFGHEQFRSPNFSEAKLDGSFCTATRGAHLSRGTSAPAYPARGIDSQDIIVVVKCRTVHQS